MKQTTNYFLNKPELTDTPDITVLNPSFDKIDTELKARADKDTEIVESIDKVKEDYLPKTGGTLTGDVALSEAVVKNATDEARTEIYGGTDFGNGSGLVLFGKDNRISQGGFQLLTDDGTNSKALVGRPDGSFSWDGAQVLTTANGLPLTGGTMTGDITMSGAYLKTTDSANRLELYGSDDYANGASMFLFGKDYLYGKGTFQLIAKSDVGSKVLAGYPDGTLSWDGNNIIRSVNGTNADASGNVTLELGGTISLLTSWVLPADSSGTYRHTTVTGVTPNKLIYVVVDANNTSHQVGFASGVLAPATSTYNSTGANLSAVTKNNAVFAVNIATATSVVVAVNSYQGTVSVYQ